MTPADHFEAWLSKANKVLERFRGPARTVLAWSRYLFTPLAIALLLYVAWSSRDLLGAVLGRASVGGLVAAVTLWSVLHVTVPLFDLSILKGLEDDTRYVTLLRIYLARLPAKYVPGGIWHNVTRLLDLNQAGVPRPYLTSLAILQILIPACLAFIIGGSLVYLDRGLTGWGWVGGASAAGSTLILFSAPSLLNRSVLRGRGHLPAMGYAYGALLAATTWIFAAVAFYTYISAYPTIELNSSMLDVAGAYLMAWGTGFISIFTPQGFGVFETTAASLLASTADFQVMIAIIAGFRLIILASDAMAWIASQAARRFLVPREGLAQRDRESTP